MKILHTADWHLGKRLDGHLRLEEQTAVMQEICEIAEKEAVDAVLIAGDLYDTFNPSHEAISLFFKTLKRLSNDGKRPVIAIAGNHDAPQLIETPDPLARECGIILTGYPDTKVPEFELETGLKITKTDHGFIELALPDQSERLRLILTPYANELRMKQKLGNEDSEQELRDLLAKKWATLANQYCDKKGVNILMTHLFMVKEGDALQAEPDDEKPILHVGGAQAVYAKNVPEQMQYVALGHLHRRQTVAKEPCQMVYASSPLAYSFAEANQDKYVVIVEAEANKEVTTTPIKLQSGHRLIRKRFEDIDEAVKWLSDNTNCWVELTIVSDTYITGADKKRLYGAHEQIVSIIPEITGDIADETASQTINLSDDMTTLFKQYFKHRQGQEVSEELLDLFKELQG